MNNDKWKAVTNINTALHLSLFIFSLFIFSLFTHM